MSVEKRPNSEGTQYQTASMEEFIVIPDNPKSTGTRTILSTDGFAEYSVAEFDKDGNEIPSRIYKFGPDPLANEAHNMPE